MPPFMLVLITTIVLVLIVLALLASAIRVVPEYKRLVVFRFGRLVGERGPGLVVLLPFVDLSAAVDLRELTAHVKVDAVVTQDKMLVDLELAIRYRVVDPVEIVQRVRDLPNAIEMSAKSALQAVLTKQAYSDLIYSRERIGEEVRDNLRDAVKGWGLEIIGVDLREPTKRQAL
jgi:regulator of protease activity HflC (stomatin/prohibitin superfamily)